MTLQGIRRVLEDVPDIEIVGEANSGSQVLPLIGQTNPDLVMLDIRMPQLDGLACLDRIRKSYPKLKVVMLSAYTDPEHISAALRRVRMSLMLVARGRRNSEIAEELVISPHTVRNHISNILAKLQMANRVEAAAYAIKHGVV